MALAVLLVVTLAAGPLVALGVVLPVNMDVVQVVALDVGGQWVRKMYVIR